MIKVKCKCGKRAFPSRDSAIKFMVTETDCIRVYRCDLNGTWHMTHRFYDFKAAKICKRQGQWIVVNAHKHARPAKSYEDALVIAKKFTKNRRQSLSRRGLLF